MEARATHELERERGRNDARKKWGARERMKIDRAPYLLSLYFVCAKSASLRSDPSPLQNKKRKSERDSE